MFFYVFLAAHHAFGAIQKEPRCRGSGLLLLLRPAERDARLYELEEYDLSVVTLTRAQLEDPGVAALTVSVLRSDLLE